MLKLIIDNMDKAVITNPPSGWGGTGEYHFDLALGEDKLFIRFRTDLDNDSLASSHMSYLKLVYSEYVGGLIFKYDNKCLYFEVDNKDFWEKISRLIIPEYKKRRKNTIIENDKKTIDYVLNNVAKG